MATKKPVLAHSKLKKRIAVLEKEVDNLRQQAYALEDEAAHTLLLHHGSKTKWVAAPSELRSHIDLYTEEPRFLKLGDNLAPARCLDVKYGTVTVDRELFSVSVHVDEIKEFIGTYKFAQVDASRLDSLSDELRVQANQLKVHNKK